MNDEFYMKKAIELAASAAAHGNEPFGAVLVKDDEIVYTNENQIFTLHNPSEHAEMGIIRRFCPVTGITDLRGYTMYASCEPCFMCSGALVYARLGRLVFAAGNTDLSRVLGREGCSPSAIVFEHSTWKPQVTTGVLKEESIAIIRDYFATHKKA